MTALKKSRCWISTFHPYDCRYLDFGGDEQQGVSALAESYVGFPNMVNVMIEWLHAAGYRKREIQNLVEEHLKTVILRNFDTTKADLIFTEEVGTDACRFSKMCSFGASLASW